MSYSKSTHYSALRSATRQVVEILRLWLIAIVDTIAGLVIFASLLSLSGEFLTLWPQGTITSLVVNMPGLVVFYAMASALVFALIVGVILPELGWLAEDTETKYDSDSVKGVLSQTINNVSSSIYTAVVIWVGTLVGYGLSLELSPSIAFVGLLAIPSLDFYYLRRFESSPLWIVAIVTFLTTTPIIFLFAVLVYSLRRTGHAVSQSIEIVSSTVRALDLGVQPGQGSLVDEIVLITRISR